MRGLLAEKCPDRFDTLSEAELRQQISKFLVREMKYLLLAHEDNGDGVTRGRGKEIPMPNDVRHFMVALFNDDPAIKPKPFLVKLKQKLVDFNVKWNRGEEYDQEDVSS